MEMVADSPVRMQIWRFRVHFRAELRRCVLSRLCPAWTGPADTPDSFSLPSHRLRRGEGERHTAWSHVTTAFLRGTSLKRIGTRRNFISGRSRERQKQRDEVRLWQGQHPGQLWQHRSLFPAPPLLPRSRRVGVLLNQIQSGAPITNDTASLGMCWAGKKTHSFVTLQKIWSNNSSWVQNWHAL